MRTVLGKGHSVAKLVYFQVANSTEFTAYDYGTPEANLKAYGIPTPPVYDLKKVTVPVAAYYGDNDWLVVPQVIYQST